MEQEANIEAGAFTWELRPDAMVQRCVKCGTLTRGVNGYGAALCETCALRIADGEEFEPF